MNPAAPKRFYCQRCRQLFYNTQMYIQDSKKVCPHCNYSLSKSRITELSANYDKEMSRRGFFNRTLS